MESYWLNIIMVSLGLFWSIVFIFWQYNRVEIKHRVVQIEENEFILQRLYIWGWEKISESKNKDMLMTRCKELNKKSTFEPVILDCA